MLVLLQYYLLEYHHLGFHHCMSCSILCLLTSSMFILYSYDNRLTLQPFAINIVSRLVPTGEFTLPPKYIVPLPGITDILFAHGSDNVYPAVVI